MVVTISEQIEQFYVRIIHVFIEGNRIVDWKFLFTLSFLLTSTAKIPTYLGGAWYFRGACEQKW